MNNVGSDASGQLGALDDLRLVGEEGTSTSIMLMILLKKGKQSRKPPLQVNQQTTR